MHAGYFFLNRYPLDFAPAVMCAVSAHTALYFSGA